MIRSSYRKPSLVGVWLLMVFVASGCATLVDERETLEEELPQSVELPLLGCLGLASRMPGGRTSPKVVCSWRTTGSCSCPGWRQSPRSSERRPRACRIRAPSVSGSRSRPLTHVWAEPVGNTCRMHVRRTLIVPNSIAGVCPSRGLFESRFIEEVEAPAWPARFEHRTGECRYRARSKRL